MTEAVCSFCGEATSDGQDGDGVRLCLDREVDETARQQLWAHARCLSDALEPDIAEYLVDAFPELEAEIRWRAWCQTAAARLQSDLDLLPRDALVVSVRYEPSPEEPGWPQGLFVLETRGEPGASWIGPTEDTLVGLILELAQRAQDDPTFDYVYSPWPVCPEHPESAHSLDPQERAGRAVWVCPESHHEIAEIGFLARSDG